MAFNANLPEEPLFDLHGSLERMGGDRNLLGAVIRFFFEDAPGLLAKIRAAIAESNPAALERAAHSLKGLVANFGAEKVICSTAALEQMGREHQLSSAPATLSALEPELAQLMVALKPHLTPEAPPGS